MSWRESRAELKHEAAERRLRAVAIGDTLQISELERPDYEEACERLRFEGRRFLWRAEANTHCTWWIGQRQPDEEWD